MGPGTVKVILWDCLYSMAILLESCKVTQHVRMRIEAHLHDNEMMIYLEITAQYCSGTLEGTKTRRLLLGTELHSFDEASFN
jgi:hypothetical protein